MDDRHARYMGDEDIWLFGRGEAQQAWRFFGCHHIPELDEHRFAVWAPGARGVSVVGDFNGWDACKNPMERHPSGVWRCFVPGLKSGDIYKYGITGRDGKTRLKADPFAFHAETGPKTGSRVWEFAEFGWTDGDYLSKEAGSDPHTAPISIYEVHLGSWKTSENAEYPRYRELADGLADYCADMGYTHVELLPINEYPYDGSWGYQVTGYFAPTSRYGTPRDFMYFVDRLHSAGIGVIADWVPAHFPKDEHGLALFDGTPCFERGERRMAEHPEWGTLIFDYDKPQVQSFLISSALFLMDVYHVDGIRVDAVSSMLYLDYGRAEGAWTPNADGGNVSAGAVAFLKKLNASVAARCPGRISVAEESSAFPLVTAPPGSGGLGFTFKWDMGFMHDTLDYFSIDPYFRSKNHEKLTFSLMYAFSEKYVLAFSHDEVVHGKKSMLGKMYGDYDQKFATLRALFGYQFAHPGKKLTFMGSEFGQFIEWDYKKQLDWFLLDYPRHGEMRLYARELNRVYASSPAMYEIDGSWDGFCWLNVEEKNRSCIAFMRTGKDAAKPRLVCLCNFTPNASDLSFGLPFPGPLQMILNSDEHRFGGTGLDIPAEYRSEKRPFGAFPYSVSLTLPPLSALYFRYSGS